MRFTQDAARMAASAHVEIRRWEGGSGRLPGEQAVTDAERRAPQGAVRSAEPGAGRWRGPPSARERSGRYGVNRGCGSVPSSAGQMPACRDLGSRRPRRRRHGSRAPTFPLPSSAVRARWQGRGSCEAEARPVGAWPSIWSPQRRCVKVAAATALVTEPRQRPPGSLPAAFHLSRQNHKLHAWWRSPSRARSSVRPAASRSRSRCPRTRVFISTSAGLATTCSGRTRATAASSAHTPPRPVPRGNWRPALPSCEAKAEPSAGLG